MKCRHCNSNVIAPFLDLGSAPPSNSYLTEQNLQSAETWFPLRLKVCESCWLVQTEDYAGREALFTGDYAYYSSFSTSWLTHAERYVQQMIQFLKLDSSSQVVEIASNDGYLLQYVQSAGIPCYGIEPTAGTAAAARTKGIAVVEKFFGAELASELVSAGKQGDLLIANNVLAHVPDINDFVRGFARLLKPGGVASFEFPHLLRMVQERQFDTAYHEHYSYLSLTATQRIFSVNGLEIFQVEELPTHGGSLRVFAQRSDTGSRAIDASVETLLKCETAAGVLTSAFYRNFQTAAETIKYELLRFLIDLKSQGLKVAAYGAAAKGNTLLNFAGVRGDLIAYVVDRNPAKQGKFMPGSRIPIVDEMHLKKSRPDRILILPWNLIGELKAQLAYVADWGGQLFTAIPSLSVLDRPRS